MEQHTAKRLRYSFLFLLSAIALLILVISTQGQIIFGQAEDMAGETPKEIITACGDNELAALGANGLRCKTVEAMRAPTTQDINITNTTCPFGIKNFNIDSLRNLSYECVAPVDCSENQFLSVQADLTFTCIGYNVPILKNQSCGLRYIISGFDEEGVPICTPHPYPFAGISCPEGQYIKGVKTYNGLYMFGPTSDSLYELDTTGRSPARIIGAPFNTQEKVPRSTTSHNGKLYMIGSESDSLWELDTTGRSPARRIGTSFKDQEIYFKDQTILPKSITSHNGKLYMVESDTDSLYELNTEATGRSPATKIGDSFGGQEGLPESITSHNGKLYMVGRQSGYLYELDTTGRSPARRIGGSFGPLPLSHPKSITSHNGKLYMVGRQSDSLYELDTTGRSPARRIGGGFGNIENDPRSITSHNGKLYMIGGSADRLYELNTEATGDSARIIGTSFGVQEGEPESITSHSRTEVICENFIN